MGILARCGLWWARYLVCQLSVKAPIETVLSATLSTGTATEMIVSLSAALHSQPKPKVKALEYRTSSACFQRRGEKDHCLVSIMARGVSEGKRWLHPTQQERWLLRIQRQSTLRESHFCWAPEREEVCEPFVQCKNIPVMPDEGSKDQLMSLSAHLRKSWKTIAISNALCGNDGPIKKTRNWIVKVHLSIWVADWDETTCWFKSSQLNSSLVPLTVCHTH